MSGPQLPYALSDAVSNLVRHIPDLLRRLRDLENEEAELDAKARQLVLEQPHMTGPKLKDRPSTPSRPAISISTPVSKMRPTASMTAKCTPSTPPLVDSKSVETPMKAFLLMQSFTLAMSIKSKRKGRIFMTGDSTEFGERT